MTNINFEDIPKHEVTDRTLKNLEKVMYTQDEFEVKKYGMPLTHSYNYNWLEMFMEEMADGLKYIQCEIDRKAEIVNLLEAALRVDNPKVYIESVLELLTIKGTGK